MFDYWYSYVSRNYFVWPQKNEFIYFGWLVLRHRFFCQLHSHFPLSPRYMHCCTRMFFAIFIQIIAEWLRSYSSYTPIPPMTQGSYYLSRHSWPSPPIFLSIAIFLSCFLPPFWVSLSVFCARKLHLLKSLFLNKNLNQIDSLIPTLIIFILRWRWWWQWRPQVFCWRSKRAWRLPHWMGGGGGGGCKCCAGGPKGIALASFDQGLVSFWVWP